MDYEATLSYLFKQLPMFQRIGNQAFKKNLDNIKALSAALGHPEQGFKSVHLAGTNGKGSTTHILAAILQKAGYKVGVYSSPHYKDFRERIKINGEYIQAQEVVDFVAVYQSLFEGLQPSFFELTVAMAFDHFKRHEVDIALVETGLGGRLDSTNILLPVLSIITNIGYDHEAQLGSTIPLIASEKAGIIKKNIPVIIGESHAETTAIFLEHAKQQQAPIIFADKVIEVKLKEEQATQYIYQVYSEAHQLDFPALALDLQGNYQQHNLKTALLAAFLLRDLGFPNTDQNIVDACANVQGISGLIGRWQIISKEPLTLCDSAHNIDGLRYIVSALRRLAADQLHLVFGTVNDKDWTRLWPIMPKEAIYYFCKANIPRGLEASSLQEQAATHGLKGNAYNSVQSALEAAQAAAGKHDVVFVGGSIFVVAEVL